MEEKAIRGIPWTFLTLAGSRLVQIGGTVVLARLLVPEDFGLVALALTISIFLGLVEEGMTATKGRPRKRAKYASETAVEPLEASTIVVPSVIQPLHRP